MTVGMQEIPTGTAIGKKQPHILPFGFDVRLILFVSVLHIFLREEFILKKAHGDTDKRSYYRPCENIGREVNIEIKP